MTDSLNHVLRHFRNALAVVLRDQGVLLLLVAAPVLYGFFYPWFYATEVVTQVPVAVVDLDHSSLSRQITRLAEADPNIAVTLVTGNEQEAREALWSGAIGGYAVLPADLQRKVFRSEAAAVNVEANAAYALINKAVQRGFAESVGTASAVVEIRRLETQGQSAAQARASRSPVQLQTVALFNPTEGYGSYVVPAVALLILQQTLLMGAALLAGTWVERGQHHASPGVWVARLAALCTLGLASGLLYFGWIFVWHDYPRGGNAWGALLLLLFYVPTNAALGLLLGLCMGNRERALQVLLFTTLPMVFLAGFSWPVEALPLPLQWLRWLVPSTAGVQASLRLNQLGAPLADVLPHLGVLLALFIASTTELVWKGRRPRAAQRMQVSPASPRLG
ncbi:ABC transporter permease [Simplicispira suum]|uniref:ABC transporter permease n=1 Tax=Simplicispira suum TaxID=2109915 RepID=A0A2S0MVP9_9BURK|nr:ABC transporter permease [Simplicispira suum]AVO39955.1 ABC transporter permease [Simplicispira suum]